MPISSVRSHGKAVLPSLSRCLSPCHSVLRLPLSPVLFFGDGFPHTARAAFKLGFQLSCLLRLPGSSLLVWYPFTSWYSVLLRTKTFPRVTMQLTRSPGFLSNYVLTFPSRVSSLSRTAESCLLCQSACCGASASTAAGDVSTVLLVYRYDVCQTGGFEAHIWLEYHVNLLSRGVSRQTS